MSGTKRISALTELASGSVDEDDILAIVDMSQASVTDKTKHVKVKNLIAVGGRLEIDSFAELATKFVGSSPSSTQQIAATNDIVVWREKGFRYQCVTSGEHFDYTGSGGLKWKVLPWNGRYNVQAFGATGDGVTDDTTAIQAGIDVALAAQKTLHIPAGTYLYSSLDAVVTANASIVGDGSSLTVLKFTGTGIALDLGNSSGYTQGIFFKGITVEGNEDTTSIIRATCLARCIWDDINVREADATSGYGFLFRACSLNQFNFLQCSQNRNAMTNPPAEGVRIEALSPYGNSSNNTFINLYSEGAGASEPTIDIGIRITGGDQNTFIGGSPEACKTYGLLVAANCRYNVFIGVGFENLSATADVGDAGIQNRYINCYSSQSFIIQGRSIVVQGGHFERIQIDAAASRSRVQDVTVNNWATGSGGFVDNSTSSFHSNIYDQDASAFIYPKRARTGITVGASPFTWANSTGQFVEVVAQTGTLTQVRILRGGDAWLVSTATPNAHLLGPGDSIEIAYSVAPTLSYVPNNGFQG